MLEEWIKKILWSGREVSVKKGENILKYSEVARESLEK